MILKYLIKFPLNAKISCFFNLKAVAKKVIFMQIKFDYFLINIKNFDLKILLQNILTWHFFPSKGFCCFFKLNGKNPNFFTSGPQSSGLQAVFRTVTSPPQQPGVLHSLVWNLALSSLQGWEHAVQLLQFPQLSTFYTWSQF